MYNFTEYALPGSIFPVPDHVQLYTLVLSIACSQTSDEQSNKPYCHFRECVRKGESHVIGF